MSLHRYFVAPPLALAVHPAPIPKPAAKKDEKTSKDKDAGLKGATVKADKDAKEVKNGKDEDKKPAEKPVEAEKKEDVKAEKKAEKSSKADDKAQNPDSKGQEEPVQHVSLQLLGAIPPRPVRTKLDLDPAIPYPPINTDPRGAYYKYAKFIQGEWQLIDVTKDGWLTEQWRELPEREALARLRGESQKIQQRQSEELRRLAELRKVPHSTRELLLQLWNDLVKAASHECEVDTFWSRYDWTDTAAQVHLTSLDLEKEQPDDLEWTREGIEETLASVGVQLSYNTAKPLPRNWAEPAGAFLIQGHGYFMLRLDNAIQWKSADAVGDKFQPLVASSNDRVFGEMVKAQQAADRKKKEAAYRERKLAEKAKAEKEKKEAGKAKPTETKPVEQAKAGEEKEDAVAIDAADGKPEEDKRKEVQMDRKESGKEGASVEKEDAKKDPAKAAKAQKDKELIKDIVGPDQKRKAELLTQMLKAGEAPPGMSVDDVKLAIKALETVTAQQKTEEKKPVIWVWGDRCEKWRWNCFEAGLPLVTPGGWEERDWKVFADNRGVYEYDEEEGWAEEDEEDVHDWTC